MNHRVYFVHALSPLHPGTGQGAGVIDLPIARDRVTDHPLLPGSSVKGVLRECSRRQHADTTGSLTWKLFGPDRDNAATHAGALQLSDARVLLFPVQSDRGTFAWVTCPLVLQRFERDSLGALARAKPKLQVSGWTVGSGRIRVAKASALRVGQDQAGQDRVVLDGHRLTVQPDDMQPDDKDAQTDLLAELLAGWVFADKSWQALFRQRLAVVDNELFTWFTQLGTELRTRICLDEETGTVRDGGLWTEESLPTETVLAGVMRVEGGAVPKPWQNLAALMAQPVQLGGHASTGQGTAWLRLAGGEA